VNDFLLPHEVLDGAGVPGEIRYEIAYRVLCAKYCALVEAVLAGNGGKPLELDLDRVREINEQDWRTTDPAELVMVAEDATDRPAVKRVRLAATHEVKDANRRYALHRMGGSRN
jgi:hypothetical protein